MTNLMTPCAIYPNHHANPLKIRANESVHTQQPNRNPTTKCISVRFSPVASVQCEMMLAIKSRSENEWKAIKMAFDKVEWIIISAQKLAIELKNAICTLSMRQIKLEIGNYLFINSQKQWRKLINNLNLNNSLPDMSIASNQVAKLETTWFCAICILCAECQAWLMLRV